MDLDDLRGRASDVELPGDRSGMADRITFLLAEYRILVGAVILAIAVLWSRGQVALPTLPPIIYEVARATILIGPPAYFLSERYVVDPIYSPDTVAVHEEDPLRGVDRAWSVPEGLWRDREIGDYDAWKPRNADDESNADWKVRKLEYDEDLNQIRIEGLSNPAPKPEEAGQSQKWLSDMWDEFQKEATKAKEYRQRMTSIAHDVQRRTITTMTAVVERGVMIDQGDALQDAVDDATESIDPGPTWPTLSEYVEETDDPSGPRGPGESDDPPRSGDPPGGDDGPGGGPDVEQDDDLGSEDDVEVVEEDPAIVQWKNGHSDTE